MNSDIYFNFHPVNFLIISGVLQVFILSGILLFRRGNFKRGDRFLAFLLLVINLHLTYLMILDLNLDNLLPQLLWIPYSFLTATGPLLYFYTQSFTQPGFSFSKRKLLHFLPLVLEVILQFSQIGQAIVSREMYYQMPSDTYVTLIIYISASFSILYYLRKSMKEIMNYEEMLVQQFSEIGKRTLEWLRKLMSYYRLFWIVWIPFAIIFMMLFRAQIQNYFTIASVYFLLILLTYLTYWVGLQGLLKGSIMDIGDLTKRTKSSSYSHLSEADKSTLTEAIERQMLEKKLYLNPTLSLNQFAKCLDKDPNLVSFLLNNHLKKTFYELVNTHRITEVTERLNQGDAEKFTLLSIALESGFNSKTSFNRVFKDITGFTPSQYLKKHSKK